MTKCYVENPCFHCKEKGKNHRSLYQTLFSPNYTEQNNTITVNVIKGQTENLNDKESLMLTIGEQVIIKAALVEALHPDKSTSEAARIMMDTGNRRTYVTK